jgi:transposase
MTRFPTAAHLSSWARFASKVKESAGRRKGTSATGHGNPYLTRTLGNVAASAGRTQTFLGERYRRIRRRRGPQRAIVAVGRSVLVIVWHLLSDAHATCWRHARRACRGPVPPLILSMRFAGRSS